MTDGRKLWTPVIMFIDDDAAILVAYLDRFNNSYVKAIGANSIGDAIRKIDAFDIDCIVTDVLLDPSGDLSTAGSELVCFIRKLNRDPPIVGVSAHAAAVGEIAKGDLNYLFSKKSAFGQPDGLGAMLKEIASEYKHKVEKIHDSLFISYGGPDEIIAPEINSFLRRQRIRTWFFPRDALPGQKLHRVVSEGVNLYDRVLLICSSASLGRSGVLNEIERVLEREAREGGSEILIPITIDDYVFTTWSPDRTDVADQVQSRVISRFPTTNQKGISFQEAGEKLVAALRR